MTYKDLIVHTTFRDKRFQLGLRHQDIADILGFKITDRISHWEKGTAIPNLINLFKLCAILNTVPQDLYPELFNKAIITLSQKPKQII